MKNKNTLNVGDLISIGVYSAVYFIFLTIGTFTSAILVPAYGMILIPAFVALFSSVPYYLLALKLQKFGAITIMGFIMGIFYFVSGHFPLSFVPALILSIVADGIAYTGKYKSKILLVISYVIFGFINAGPILPLYFLKNAYIENLVARGKDSTYIDKLFSQISVTTFFIFLIATVVAGLISSIFALKMMKKHFEKAGVI